MVRRADGIMYKNSTSDCYSQVPSNIYVVCLILMVSCTLLALSVFIVIVICRTRALHTNTNIMMASLAVSNIVLTSAAACIVDESVSVTTAQIPKKNIFACFVLGGGMSSTALTIMHMCAIAVDRYIRVTHPFYYMKSVTCRHILIILTSQWTSSVILLTIPMLVYTDNKYHQHCIILNPPLEFFSVFVSFYVISCAIICVAYMKISILAFRHKTAANSRRMLTDGGDVVFKRNCSAALRSVKFFALMFGVFLAFTVPPTLATVLNYFYPVQQSVHFSLLLLFVLNSLVNSCIYIYMNREFVLVVRRLMSYIKLGCCQLRD